MLLLGGVSFLLAVRSAAEVVGPRQASSIPDFVTKYGTHYFDTLRS